MFDSRVIRQVFMLYVHMVVNGVPLKAFIDSGAQMSIMSVSCAESCGVMRLVDRRFQARAVFPLNFYPSVPHSAGRRRAQGTAVGVGTQKIIGRVHQCPVKARRSRPRAVCG